MDGATRGLRAGVIGVGSLGMNHARNYAAMDGVELVCLHDIDRGRAEEAARRFGGLVCGSIDDLLGQVDAVSVCTPATDHVEAVTAAMERGVHVLVEKPIASSAAEGKKLVRLAAERGVRFQVGHIERFNGAYEAAARLLDRPRFIESHRLGTFTPRGTDVSVVVDLMIHDIDLVLDVLGGEELVDLRASGAGVLTDSPDIVNARLEFAGGCVANLTASRTGRSGSSRRTGTSPPICGRRRSRRSNELPGSIRRSSPPIRPASSAPFPWRSTEMNRSGRRSPPFSPPSWTDTSRG